MLAWYDCQGWKSFNQSPGMDTAGNTGPPAPCSRTMWGPSWTNSAFPGFWTKWSGEAQREFFLLQNEPSACISFGEEWHNMKDSNREHWDWGGTAAQTEGPAVPAAQGPGSSTATGPAVPALPSSHSLSALWHARHTFPRHIWRLWAHNNTELSVLWLQMPQWAAPKV